MLSVAPPVPPTVVLRWLNALMNSASKLIRDLTAHREALGKAEIGRPEPGAVQIHVLRPAAPGVVGGAMQRGVRAAIAADEPFIHEEDVCRSDPAAR